MYSDDDTPKGWVAPFGYPRIKACSRLPMAFRSVPRPSSPPGAKASTECPYRAQYTERIPGQEHAPLTMHRNHHPAKTHAAQHLQATSCSNLTQHITQTPLNTATLAGGRSSAMALTTNNTIPSGQNISSRRDGPSPCQHPNPKAYAGPDSQPSRPTRPETHQNQIHSNKRTDRTRQQSTAPRSRGHIDQHRWKILTPITHTRSVWRLSDSNR